MFVKAPPRAFETKEKTLRIVQQSFRCVSICASDGVAQRILFAQYVLLVTV